ncbi:MAG TPA: hypothetical protein VF188_13220 [Longimicrobiales bacterium]
MEMYGNRTAATWRRPVAVLALLLAACADDRITAPDAHEPAGRVGPTPLGLVEVTITGLGQGTQPVASVLSASSVGELEALRAARHSSAAAGLALQSLAPPANGDASGDGTIQLEPISVGSFTDGERGAGGVRYLRATFRVRNAQADSTPYDTPRHNLTFLAVDTDGSLGETAVTELTGFDGNPVANAAALALEVLPTGAAVRTTDGEIASQAPDVLQVLTETEAAGIDLTGHDGVNAVFPYGFVVRSPNVTPGSRELPASPADDEFDGVVTFAFKLPLQADASDDPFEISIVFLAVDDSQVRLTESPEEANLAGAAALAARAAELGPTTVVTLLGNSTTLVSGHTLRRICRVRTAGTNPASPLATLVDAGAPCLDGDALPDNVRVVDRDAAAGGSGETWATAFKTLQDALTCVRDQAGSGEPCEGVDEIWVAEGVYYPDEGEGYTLGDATASFELIEGVGLYGGFAGNESVRDQRDPTLHPTVLSGDVGRDDTVDVNGVTVDWDDQEGSNARVFYVDGSVTPLTRATVVDGFTITGGGTGAGSDGAGLYCNGSGSGGACSPTFRQVTFTGNIYRAAYLSAGSGGESSPLFVDAVFRGNSAANLDGGAVYITSSGGTASPEFVRVTFLDNEVVALGNGGAVFVNSQSGGTVEPLYVNVVFQGNSANSDGGAMYIAGGTPTLVNVVFRDNTSASGAGGAVRGAGLGKFIIANATFSGNTGSGSAGAILGNFTIANIIAWGNGPNPVVGASGNTAHNSIIEGGCPANIACTDVLDQDPLFIDAAGGDLRLDQLSPALDAGDNEFVLLDAVDLDGDGETNEFVPFDLDGRSRFFDWGGDSGTGAAIVDMGAYEKQR